MTETRSHLLNQSFNVEIVDNLFIKLHAGKDIDPKKDNRQEKNEVFLAL